METFNTALFLIENNCYMASIDLKDAYYSVAIHPDDRKYLRFMWNNQLFEYTCLPNGLSCAPRVFTKMLKPIFSLLRSQGFVSVYYLDDILLFRNSPQDCVENVNVTLAILRRLGFFINYSKSSFLPSNKVEFLGFELDSTTMLANLPPRKCDDIDGSLHS